MSQSARTSAELSAAGKSTLLKRKATSIYGHNDEAIAMSSHIFSKLDSDHSGLLEAKEIHRARDLMLSVPASRETGLGARMDSDKTAVSCVDAISTLMTELDANHDGCVDTEEWNDFNKALYEVLGQRQYLRIARTWASNIQEADKEKDNGKSGKRKSETSLQGWVHVADGKQVAEEEIFDSVSANAWRSTVLPRETTADHDDRIISTISANSVTSHLSGGHSRSTCSSTPRKAAKDYAEFQEELNSLGKVCKAAPKRPASKQSGREAALAVAGTSRPGTSASRGEKGPIAPSPSSSSSAPTPRARRPSLPNVTKGHIVEPGHIPGTAATFDCAGKDLKLVSTGAMKMAEPVPQAKKEARSKLLSSEEHGDTHIKKRSDGSETPARRRKPGRERGDTLDDQCSWRQTLAASCSTPGCPRPSRNGQLGESCCRYCKTTAGGDHGPDCQERWTRSSEAQRRLAIQRLSDGSQQSLEVHPSQTEKSLHPMEVEPSRTQKSINSIDEERVRIEKSIQSAEVQPSRTKNSIQSTDANGTQSMEVQPRRTKDSIQSMDTKVIQSTEAQPSRAKNSIQSMDEKSVHSLEVEPSMIEKSIHSKEDDRRSSEKSIQSTEVQPSRTKNSVDSIDAKSVRSIEVEPIEKGIHSIEEERRRTEKSIHSMEVEASRTKNSIQSMDVESCCRTQKSIHSMGAELGSIEQITQSTDVEPSSTKDSIPNMEVEPVMPERSLQSMEQDLLDLLDLDEKSIHSKEEERRKSEKSIQSMEVQASRTEKSTLRLPGMEVDANRSGQSVDASNEKGGSSPFKWPERVSKGNATCTPREGRKGSKEKRDRSISSDVKGIGSTNSTDFAVTFSKDSKSSKDKGTNSSDMGSFLNVDRSKKGDRSVSRDTKAAMKGDRSLSREPNEDHSPSKEAKDSKKDDRCPTREAKGKDRARSGRRSLDVQPVIGEKGLERESGSLQVQGGLQSAARKPSKGVRSAELASNATKGKGDHKSVEQVAKKEWHMIKDKALHGELDHSEEHFADNEKHPEAEFPKHRTALRTESGSFATQAATMIQTIHRGRLAKREAEKQKKDKTEKAEKRAKKTKQEIPLSDPEELFQVLCTRHGRTAGLMDSDEFLEAFARCKKTGLDSFLPKVVPQSYGDDEFAEDISTGQVAFLCRLIQEQPDVEFENDEDAVRENLIHSGASMDEEDIRTILAQDNGTLNLRQFKRLFKVISMLMRIDEVYIAIHCMWILTGHFEMTDVLVAMMIEDCAQKVVHPVEPKHHKHGEVVKRPRCPGGCGFAVTSVHPTHCCKRCCKFGGPKNGHSGKCEQVTYREVCTCGTVWMKDELHCRQCGVRRPKQEAKEELPDLASYTTEDKAQVTKIQAGVKGFLVRQRQSKPDLGESSEVQVLDAVKARAGVTEKKEVRENATGESAKRHEPHEGKAGDSSSSESEASSNSSEDLPDLMLLKEKFTLNDLSRMSYNSGIVDPRERTGLPFMSIGQIFGSVCVHIPDRMEERAAHRQHTAKHQGKVKIRNKDFLKGRTHFSILMEALYQGFPKGRTLRSPLQLCLRMLQNAKNEL